MDLQRRIPAPRKGRSCRDAFVLLVLTFVGLPTLLAAAGTIAWYYTR